MGATMAGKGGRRWAVWLAVLLCLAGASKSAAQSYDLGMDQLRHVAWTRSDGAPAVIYTMTQTGDGFLWLASRDGLFRFDGLQFEPMDADIDRAVYGNPRRVLTGRDGSVWVWYPKGWLAVYRLGRLSFARAPEMGGEVATFDQTQDGSIWLGVAQIGQPFKRYHHGRWETVTPNPNREMLRDAFESADGAFWLTYNRSVLRRPPGGTRFERVDVPVTEGTLLAADAQGAVWMAGPNGGRRLSGPAGRWPTPLSDLVQWRSQDPGWQNAAFDASGNLWIRGRDFGRVPGLVQAQRAGVRRLVYEDGQPGLMSSPRPSGLFVDRRGNVWYGGPRTLDRFSVPAVVVEPRLTTSAKYGDVLFTSSTGVVYIGQNDAVYRVDPGEPPLKILSTAAEPRAICEDRDGAVWIVLDDRTLRLAGGAETRFSTPATETGIYECGADPGGRFWLTASTSGMFWRDGNRWNSVLSETASPDFDPTLKWTDPQGRLWVLTEPDALARIEGGLRESRAIDITSGLGEIRALHSTTGGLLISGMEGAALMTPAGVVQMADRQTASLRYATGLVQTRLGDTWLFRSTGLIRLKTSDLAKAVSDSNFIIPERLFTYEDGLPNGPNAQSWRSMVQGGDGRLWLATIDGIAWVDPANLPANPTPPGVAITSLISGGSVVKDPVRLRLAAGIKDITIGFAALSLSMPERVKVLYRLEGHDADWVDPGSRRQAFYTNLAPGSYRFHVIAANEDGVWNRVGDDLHVSIPPTFLQSIWFKLLVAIGAMALAWTAYTLRVRQVTTAFEARFRIRTAERERIARELHDTLLQGFQGLMLRFQSVSERLPRADPLRAEVDEALTRADTVLVEGRSRVQDLRSQAAHIDLAESLIEACGDPNGLDTPPVDVLVEGMSRPTNPMVAEEILRIAQEAIRNAIQHADAKRISVVLTFARRGLALVVVDDGVGLPGTVLETGARPGHFGLTGMRERAERVGGQLTLISRPQGGAEVRVHIPARAAYVAPSGRWRWMRRLGVGKAEPS
jgi:signal transduction histidine kinase/ligand-binding sensor domain-containing protein